MEWLIDNIDEYLKKSSSLSFQIRGEYGKGKTYFVKHILPGKLREKGSERIQIMISLFDLQNIKEIPAKLLNAYILSKRDKNQDIYEDICKGYDYLETKYGRNNTITNYNVDNEPEVVFKIIPKDSVYICLDDISRFLAKGNVEDFVGFVNELVENLGYKVILIWNDSDDINKDDYIKYREKIVGRSFEYEASIETVVKSFSEETNDENFISYIAENIKYFLPECHQETPHSKYFKNLRSLKFALENFYDVFKLYQDDLSDEKVKLQLMYYLTFTIGVSLEYKAGKLSENNKRNIDKYPEEKIEGLWDENSDSSEKIPFEEDGRKQNDTDRDYSISFYKFYIDIKFMQRYVYHPQIYDHIVSGTELNKKALEDNLESKVNLNPQVSDGNAIIDKIMYKLAAYTDEEFKIDLEKLKNFTEEGDLRGLNYFVNATIYLYGYRTIIGLEEDELKRIVSTGLDKFISDENVSIRDEFSLEAMEGLVPEECKWVISMIREKLQIKGIIKDQVNLINLVNLFNTDIVSFTKELLPGVQKSPVYTSSLKEFPLFVIKNGIRKITPEGVLNMDYLVKKRKEAGLISKEIPFWKDIQSYLKKYVDSCQPSLTKILIERILLPNLESTLKQM
ncbi:MAG: hypothetical protein U0K71_01355 [Paludibacteraceae bacterium]|nr:hypothetical protein [Paludibacteraceae bacterium]